jgi:hypothetical protein
VISSGAIGAAGYTWWIATRKEDLTKDELDRRASDFFAQMSQK